METEAGAVRMEKKVRVKKAALPVASEAVAGWSSSQLNDYFEKEGQMAAADKLQEDTNEAKNALEAYIYDLRNKLYEALGAYVQEVSGVAVVAVRRGAWCGARHDCCWLRCCRQMRACQGDMCTAGLVPWLCIRAVDLVPGTAGIPAACSALALQAM
jgi:hypothetical protein